jgi:putative peptidoglycan binding protein
VNTGYDLDGMKTITLLGLAGVAFVSLSQPTWAGPRSGGGGFSGGGHFGGFAGGGHSGGGGRLGGFAGGGSRAAPAFYSGGFRAAPAFRGAYFTGRSVGGLSRAPRFYYGRSGMAAVRSHGFTALDNRSMTSTSGRISTIRQNRTGSLTRQNTRVSDSQVSAANRQANRVGSIAERNRVSNPRTSTAANRQSFLRNHAFERHDANWHRDWDRHQAHFHHGHVFVFVNGLWWGLYPWDYYPYYASGYPNDYYGYPNDYSGYPYDYYGGYYPYDYYQDSNDNDSTNAASDQYASNPTVSAVQSELAKLDYYNGEVDGVLGDQTEAALARYQEDRDLSVTGTLDTATLQSLGIRR